MKEDFVSFSLAKKLKEKGYKLNYEDNFILIANSADVMALPHIYNVLKWLREEKKLSVEVFYGTAKTGNKFIDDAIKPCWRCCVVPTSENFYGVRTDLFKSTTTFASWEEATLAGIEFTLDKLI